LETRSMNRFVVSSRWVPRSAMWREAYNVSMMANALEAAHLGLKATTLPLAQLTKQARIYSRCGVLAKGFFHVDDSGLVMDTVVRSQIGGFLLRAGWFPLAGFRPATKNLRRVKQRLSFYRSESDERTPDQRSERRSIPKRLSRHSPCSARQRAGSRSGIHTPSWSTSHVRKRAVPYQRTNDAAIICKLLSRSGGAAVAVGHQSPPEPRTGKMTGEGWSAHG
jgi:hypothetical protein